MFEIPIVWLPLSYAGCSQHAPNEHIIKPLLREGIRTVTEIYWHLGEENNNTKDILRLRKSVQPSDIAVV